jgi:hypothetical protein
MMQDMTICTTVVLTIWLTLTGKVQKIYIEKNGEFSGLFKCFFHLRRFITLNVLSLNVCLSRRFVRISFVSLDVLLIYVLSHYTLCLFRRFIRICFVKLYVLSLYVLSHYTFCRYTFCCYTFLPLDVLSLDVLSLNRHISVPKWSLHLRNKAKVHILVLIQQSTSHYQHKVYISGQHQSPHLSTNTKVHILEI